MTAIIGTTLNRRYRVDEALGRGGMADVYKVWDEDRLTYLALKLLRDDLSQDLVFMRRFRREAQNLAQLQHPNIVRFFGLEEEDLQAFILMEFIDGPSLREEIRRAGSAGLAPARLQAVMADICAALHYAHKKGVVHCDIKSGNVLLDRSGKAYLTDFGIARTMDAATSTLIGAGTPAYMAPELILGQDPTPQSDIYALGILLFEMCTGGERPFTGEGADAAGTTAEKVRWQHLHAQPPSLSVYNQDAIKGMDEVIQFCLAKNPQERLASPLDLYHTLLSLQSKDRDRRTTVVNQDSDSMQVSVKDEKKEVNVKKESVKLPNDQENNDDARKKIKQQNYTNELFKSSGIYKNNQLEKISANENHESNESPSIQEEGQIKEYSDFGKISIILTLAIISILCSIALSAR